MKTGRSISSIINTRKVKKYLVIVVDVIIQKKS